MEKADGVTTGEGFAVANIEDLGDQYGFRKVRTPLGVTAFGINAISMPPGFETHRHYHDIQEEVYFLHQGKIEFTFNEGESHVLEPGGIARVDASTVRKIKNIGEGDAVYLVVGGKDGYVGRDGRVPEDDES